MDKATEDTIDLSNIELEFKAPATVRDWVNVLNCGELTMCLNMSLYYTNTGQAQSIVHAFNSFSTIVLSAIWGTITYFVVSKPSGVSLKNMNIDSLGAGNLGLVFKVVDTFSRGFFAMDVDESLIKRFGGFSPDMLKGLLAIGTKGLDSAVDLSEMLLRYLAESGGRENG